MPGVWSFDADTWGGEDFDNEETGGILRRLSRKCAIVDGVMLYDLLFIAVLIGISAVGTFIGLIALRVVDVWWSCDGRWPGFPFRGKRQ